MTRTRRQSRRQSVYGDAGENVDDHEEDKMTASGVASIMAAAQRLQTEAFERMFERLLEQRPPTPAVAAQPSGNFSMCTARFAAAADEDIEDSSTPLNVTKAFSSDINMFTYSPISSEEYSHLSPVDDFSSSTYCDAYYDATVDSDHRCSDLEYFNYHDSSDGANAIMVDPNFDKVNSTIIDPDFDEVESTILAPLSLSMPSRRPTLSITISGKRGIALIDTAAKSCIAGHKLYKLLKDMGQTFMTRQVNVKLADGIVRPRDVLVARVDVTISVNRTVNTDFVIFPEADNNETLLGIDFINAAGMVIDFAASTWHFSGNQQFYPLEYEGDEEIPVMTSSIVLREDERTMLTCEQRQRPEELLQRHEDTFRPGGEATPFAEHRIDTGDHAPIAVPPYRFTPAKKTIMEAELKEMLEDGIIEECKAAWAAPALLVPKKDGTYRFCADYRRLNAVTKTDNSRRPAPDFQEGDLVLLTTHVHSNVQKGKTKKFMPLRDGRYKVQRVVSPCTYEIGDVQGQTLGRYHSSDLTPFIGMTGQYLPVQPRRLRGRLRVQPDTPVTPRVDAHPSTLTPPRHTYTNSLSGRNRDLEEEDVTRATRATTKVTGSISMNCQF